MKSLSDLLKQLSAPPKFAEPLRAEEIECGSAYAIYDADNNLVAIVGKSAAEAMSKEV